MSVIFWDANLYGNIIRALTRHCDGEYRNQRIETLAQKCAIISRANAAAYNDRYANPKLAPASPYTAREIASNAKAVRSNVFDLKEALQVAGLLHYNCTESRDYLAEIPDGMATLVSILSELASAASDAFGA